MLHYYFNFNSGLKQKIFVHHMCIKHMWKEKGEMKALFHSSVVTPLKCLLKCHFITNFKRLFSDRAFLTFYPVPRYPPTQEFQPSPSLPPGYLNYNYCSAPYQTSLSSSKAFAAMTFPSLIPLPACLVSPGHRRQSYHMTHPLRQTLSQSPYCICGARLSRLGSES